MIKPFLGFLVISFSRNLSRHITIINLFVFFFLSSRNLSSDANELSAMFPPHSVSPLLGEEDVETRLKWKVAFFEDEN